VVDLVGQKIANFRVLEQLGAGGMGAVYRVRDERLGREVAMKVLPAELVENDAARSRFLREARSAAAIDHPNVAVVHQVLKDVDGLVVLIMELVRGETLRSRLARGPVPISEALALGATLARATQRAHESGVIHRDLKPENVMITPEGVVKVLDFGIARMTLDPSPVSVRAPTEALTATGSVLGTPGYMSPEQATGRPIDARTDVFALGAIVYEMVSGRRAFSGGSLVEVLAATTRDEPAAPSTLNPLVSAELEDLLAQALRKDVAQRLPSAALFAQRLDALARGIQAHEQAPTAVLGTPSAVLTTGAPVAHTRGDVARPAVRRASTIAVAVVVVAALAVGGRYWLRRPAPLQEPTVGLQAMALYLDATDSRRSDAESPSLWETAARDFAHASAQPGAPLRWKAAAKFAEGEAAMYTGRLADAERLHREASAIDASWAAPQIGLCSTLLRAGRYGEAIAAAQTAQALDPHHWLPVAATARAYAAKGDLQIAIQEFRRALSMAEQNHALRAELALAYHAGEFDEEADRQAKLALEGDPDLVEARVLLAERALEAGDGAKALEHSSRAIAVGPRNVFAWLAYADAFTLLERRDEARRAYQTALRLRDTTHERGAPESRLTQAREALARGELPPPRGVAMPVEVLGPSSPAAKASIRSAPVRSAPVRSAPARSKPVEAAF
jgi:tetratricopeptide (TPR) repeat protein/tRNA A-37 threonylcarbamoyl transferase component Bud32